MTAGPAVETAKTQSLSEPVQLRRFLYWMILINIPVRLTSLGHSLWLDEAWVANSLAEPSLRQMLFYDRWVQSTPPLTLLWMRVDTAVLGSGEVALRFVALFCGIAALFVFAALMRKVYGWIPAVLASSYLSTNYWAIRYSQEAKQYGGDLLVGTIDLYLIWKLAVTRLSAIGVIGCGLACVAGSLLSLPAVFFFPATILAVWLRGLFDPLIVNRPWKERIRMVRHWEWLLLLSIQSLGLWLTYRLYWSQNANSTFRSGIVRYSGVLGTPASMFGKLWRNLGELLLPTNFLWSRVLSQILIFVLVGALLRLVIRCLRSDQNAVTLSLMGGMPLLTGLLVSARGLYPLTPHPRLILWALPCCALVLFSWLDQWRPEWTIDRRGGRLAAVLAPAVCIAASAFGFWLVLETPRTEENNRAAISYLASHMSPADRLFIHGGMFEQMNYYERNIGWRPLNAYVGRDGWPCCNLNHLRFVSNPQAMNVREDVRTLVRGASNGRLWTIMPAASDGSWSSYLSQQIESIMTALSQQGCSPKIDLFFGDTEVYQFECGLSVQTAARNNGNYSPDIPKHGT